MANNKPKAQDAPSRPTHANVHQAICAVMSAVGPIAKEHKNAQQGYKFRGIADAYQALQRLLAHNGLWVAPVAIDEIMVTQVTTRGGAQLQHLRVRVTYRFSHESGTYADVVTIGEGMDSGDKCSGKALSTAHKYALFQAFAIPEDDPIDVEYHSPEIEEAPHTPPPKPPKRGKKSKSAETAAAAHEVAKADGYQPQTEGKVIPMGSPEPDWDALVVELHADLAAADRDAAVRLLPRLKQVPDRYREDLRLAFRAAMERHK